jgi:Domain of unknown function (DUF4157)
MRDGITTPGQPLDRPTRSVMESRFGRDFSAVRVHTDTAAATSSDRLGARAYTAGSHIVFARDEFRPSTAAGAHLLAHELAHTLQQPATPRNVHRVGHPDDVAEHAAARAAADAMDVGPLPRLAPIALSPDQPHVLRRAPATTWAGEFKPERYTETYEVVDAQAHTFRPGADIKIAFVANNLVDAKEIHFIQSAETVLNNQPHAIKPTVVPRMIPTGEPGEGLHLDAPASQASPFVDYQFGVHYSEAGQNFRRDAKMTDNPGFDVQDPDSASMTFQSAAVATDGTQQGVYYGAVEWGWTRDPKQRTKKLDFKTVPWIVPGGSLFGRMAELFEASKTSQGDPTGHVPMVAVKFTIKRTTLVRDPAHPKAAGAIDLSINTQVEVLPALDPTKKGWQNVAVVSGRDAGKIGWIHEALADRETIIPKAQKK